MKKLLTQRAIVVNGHTISRERKVIVWVHNTNTAGSKRSWTWCSWEKNGPQFKVVTESLS